MTSPLTSPLTSSLVRFHLTLLRRQFSAQKMLAFQAAVLILYAVAISVAIAFWIAPSTLIAYSSIGILALWFFHYTLPAPEHQIDVERFISLPLSGAQLRPAMIAIEILQSRGIASVLCSLITAVGGSLALASTGDPVLIPVYLVGIVVSWATAITGATAIRTVAAAGSERSKQFRSVIGMMLGMGLYFAFINNANPQTFTHVLTVLGWTPFGAAVAPAQMLHSGDTVQAIATGVLGVVYLLGAWKLVQIGLNRELTEVAPAASARSGRPATSLLLPGLPYTQFGGLFSRTVRYVKRDSRMVVGNLIMVTMALGFLFYGHFADTGTQWVSLYFIAMIPLNGANTFGYDGPGSWTVLVTPTAPGKQLTVEALAYGVLALPPTLLVLTILGFFENFSGIWLAASIAMICAVVCAFALAMVLSAFNPYPTSKPGTNPMKDRSANNSNAWVTSLLVLLGFIPLIGPPLGMMLYAVNTAGVLSPLFFGGAALGVVVAALLCVFGWRVSTKRANEKMPEIYAKVGKWI